MGVVMASSRSLRVISDVGVLLLVAALFAGGQDHQVQVAAAGDILLPACKTVGGTVDVTFCVEALGSVGAGVDAETYRELAAVAADLLGANATSTAAKIDALLRDGGGGSGGGGRPENAARRLRGCRALYGGVARRQPACAAAARAGRPGEAASCVEASADAVRLCERGFAGSGAPSPVKVEGENAINLAKLAVALLHVAS